MLLALTSDIAVHPSHPIRERGMRAINRFLRTLAAAIFGILTVGNAATAQADPEAQNAAPNPFPDIRYYDELDAGDFALPGASGDVQRRHRCQRSRTRVIWELTIIPPP